MWLASATHQLSLVLFGPMVEWHIPSPFKVRGSQVTQLWLRKQKSSEHNNEQKRLYYFWVGISGAVTADEMEDILDWPPE